MKNKCEKCIHYGVCSGWTLPDYICGRFQAAPPCEVGDVLFVPKEDPDRPGQLAVDLCPVTDVGQRFIYCSVTLDDPSDTSDKYEIDRIGMDVFTDYDAACRFIDSRIGGKYERD